MAREIEILDGAEVTGSGGASNRMLRAAILLAWLLAFSVLIGAASGDLWLDEIWSINLVHHAHSAWDIFSVLRHENNHPINTLYLYLLGNPNVMLEYRLAAVFSGLACISLLGYTAWKQWGEPEALICIVMSSASFPMLLYSSEARGYSAVMALGVTAYIAWRQYLKSSGKASLLVFWSASVLGLLAQVTFVIVMIAFALGQIAEEHKLSSFSSRAASLVKVHLVPMLFAGGWYLFFVRNLVNGGGDPSGGWPVIGQACSLLLGLPDTPPFRLVAMAGVLSVLAVGVGYLWRARQSMWLFFLSVLLIAPAMLLALSYPHDFYLRYFLASFPFFMLLSCRLIGIGWRNFGRGGRYLLALTLVVYFVGNVQRDFLLLKFGRGQYSDAIKYMLRQTPDGEVRVASDHDFRNPMVLGFYTPRLPGGDRLHYIKESDWVAQQPEWFLLHSQDLRDIPSPQVFVTDVGAYSLIKTYRYAGVSGWSWYLYRRNLVGNLPPKRMPDVGGKITPL